MLLPPQVGIAYSGYSWKRNALTSAMPAVLTIATCSVQWFIVGYTLAYGEGGALFGGLDHLFHWDVLSQPVGTIPAILFSEFQLVFEATVCAIAVGGICERGRLLPVIPFIFVRGPTHAQARHIRQTSGRDRSITDALAAASFGPPSSTAL